MPEHGTQQSALATWIFAAFVTDATQDRVVRVAAVERMLLDTFGAWHVPDKDGADRYFAVELDARLQRRWMANRIVDEQDWRERFDAIQRESHGAVLPRLREAAEAQRAEYERKGTVTVTGFERRSA